MRIETKFSNAHLYEVEKNKKISKQARRLARGEKEAYTSHGMKDYLIYFAQAYPNFRRSEIESLAGLNGIKLGSFTS